MAHRKKLIVVISLLSTLVLVGGKLSAEDGEHGRCPPPPWKGYVDPQVCITDGCLRGKAVTTLHWGTYEAFVGIPFAKPPVGELRFAVSSSVLNMTNLIVLRISLFFFIFLLNQRILVIYTA